eukprot:3375339-Rhodomonas_salina.8
MLRQYRAWHSTRVGDSSEGLVNLRRRSQPLAHPGIRYVSTGHRVACTWANSAPIYAGSVPDTAQQLAAYARLVPDIA